MNERKLERHFKILTLFRNVCAHNERLFSFRAQIDFPDTVLHAELNIPKKGQQYSYGKRDLFGLLITFRYLLPPPDFMEFKNSLAKAILYYQKQSHRISRDSLLVMMGFPSDWETIMCHPI